ncbi:PEP/pyruvate-binding domain-containing protein, partial [Actinoalloteichus spitiensis]|uniref:PEP/pyruvate-binding domain-containing protein n=1 Tax=Actinoalloteichus spitiensis TaxID=252394 RepID=UPI0012F6B2D3
MRSPLVDNEVDHPFVLPLGAGGTDLSLVGGKGASLDRLIRAGLPVPAGFHVTTAAYRAAAGHPRPRPAAGEEA